MNPLVVRNYDIIVACYLLIQRPPVSLIALLKQLNFASNGIIMSNGIGGRLA